MAWIKLVHEDCAHRTFTCPLEMHALQVTRAAAVTAAARLASSSTTRLSCQSVRTMASQQHTSQVVQGKHQLSDADYLAYRYTAPASPDKPCIVFLHGLCSNMTG